MQRANFYQDGLGFKGKLSQEVGEVGGGGIQSEIQTQGSLMLLIVVGFLAGSTWEPVVSTQALPSASTCTAAMTATVHAIQSAKK